MKVGLNVSQVHVCVTIWKCHILAELYKTALLDITDCFELYFQLFAFVSNRN